ncbi:Ribosomal RNA processing protein [Dirofilaria immitis]
MRKKGYQKYIQSVFDESNDDDDDNDEIGVNLKQFKNRKTKKAKKQRVFVEKNAANQPKESLLSKECNSDTYFSAENDGFVTLNSNDDQSSNKKRICNFNRNRSDSREEELSSISNGRKNNIDFNKLQKSEIEMKDGKLSSTNSIEQEEFDRYSLDEKQTESIKKPIQNITISPAKKHEKADFDDEGFREEIAKIPLGKTKQLQERLGTKLFNKAFFVHDASSNLNKKPIQKVFMRENPKRPREVSSKMPVSKFRNIFANEKLERPILDPRFDSRCGEFNDYIYHHNYSFLDEIRQREKKILVEELKKTTEGENIDKKRLKEALRKIKNQEKTRADVNRRKEIIREIRHENNERMRQGLPPIFKTRAQIRELVWRKKYDELKGGKKLEKYLRRKTKKQDKRYDINKLVSHENEIASHTSD